MPGVFSLPQAAEAFGPVRAAGRPIFRQDNAEYTMFYAPGYLCVVGRLYADRFEITIASLEDSPRPEPVAGQGAPIYWAAELSRRADQAVAEVVRWQQREPFKPECLTAEGVQLH